MLAVAGIVIAPDISSDYESHDGLDRRADAARGREPAAARRTHCRRARGNGHRVGASVRRRCSRESRTAASTESWLWTRTSRIPPSASPTCSRRWRALATGWWAAATSPARPRRGTGGLTRVLNSRLATLLAAPLVRCSDPMAGFFAVGRSALPDLASLRPVGYKIGLELMVRGRLRVGEAPIAFDDRRRGRSKLGWRQRFDYLRHLGRLYVHVLAGRCAGRGHADDGQGQAEKAPARRRRAVRCAPRFTRNGCRRGTGDGAASRWPPGCRRPGCGGSRPPRALCRHPAAHGGSGGRRPVPDGRRASRHRPPSGLPDLHAHRPPVHPAAVRRDGVPRAPLERSAGGAGLRRRLRLRATAGRVAPAGPDRGMASWRLGAVLVAGHHHRGLHAERAAVLRDLGAGDAGCPGPAAPMGPLVRRRCLGGASPTTGR